MAFIDAQDTIVRVSDGAATPAMLPVEQIDTIGTFAGGSRTQRDRTTLASKAMVYGYGLKDNGTFTLNLFFDDALAGQARLFAMHDAVLAEETDYEVEFSNGRVWSFKGTVVESPVEIPKNADVTTSISIQINGAITKA